MKIRPNTFPFLALALVGIAISMPLQIMLIYGHTPREMASILLKLTPLNWVVILLSLSSAVAAWKASPALRVLVPLNLMAVAWNNALVAIAGTDFTTADAVVAFLSFATLHALLLTPGPRKILQHPELRWWLIPPRRRVEVPVMIQTLKGERLASTTFELSETGLFIVLDQTTLEHLTQYFESNRNPANTLAQGRYVTLRLGLGYFREMKCEAEIVRTAPDANGSYPIGLGLRFVQQSKSEKAEILHLLQHAPVLNSTASTAMN